MATTIAISGKGGSGKTTLAAMMVRALMGQSANGGGVPCTRTVRGVLAVDADPNSCLGLTMGAEVTETIAKIREQARTKQPTNEGMDRVRSFEYGIQQAITEAKGFDLVTMGRPEGPDCYCAVNNLLRKFLDKLSSQYSFVVIDNEAGMEHLSRRTTDNVDILCIIAEPTPLGEITSRRIFELAEQLPITIKQTGIIWNSSNSSATGTTKELDGVETFGCVPYDQAVHDGSMQAETIFDLETNNPAFLAVRRILEHKLRKI